MNKTSELPDDPKVLKALLQAAQTQLSQQEVHIQLKEEVIVRLEKLVADYKAAQYGRKSEKADPDQYMLAFEDLETAIAATQAEAENIAPPTNPRKKRKTNRGKLPGHLPRIEVVIEPEETTCVCGCVCHVIGKDVSERLDVIPAQFRVIVTRRPKYACRACEEGVKQAPAPDHIIEAGLPSEATLAHVITSKYADHCPLYRQAQIYARQGVDLDRSTLADWVGRSANELKPVFEALLGELKKSTKLFMDETPAPVLDPGRRKTKTGYFWALARDDRPWNGPEPPGVAFTYAPNRSGEVAEEILKDFEGVLQVDGYAGYNRLLKRQKSPVALAYCWSHARRKLYEVARNKTAPIAEEGLRQIGELYQIEKTIRGNSPEERLVARQKHSRALIEAFEEWLINHRAKVSRKSPLGEALSYIAKYWNGLIRFLDDGRIELDNNSVERTIRPITLNRKNALFAGHDAGAENWAMLASLIETCKLGGINPHTYLATTLTRIAKGHKQSKINELLPWNFAEQESQGGL
ncbi:IS66 family transposase [Pseudovibrio sp. Tun.PSC04-5.I4]|uniref:IS66 family transposase n=1 Tax=Pseudovibrio sp. Tun.PSC04-5.I4 TaxID=1798213 RepID=UPI000889EEAD|nr:IS66 family transposase [Pseudovibrio sp. Tun.PSC04-5.I4]SDR46836.1 Transposase [Pseudovibrio sp. Tun.PSC04-5.I4]